STPLSPPPRPPLFPYTTLFRSVLPSRWLRVRVPLAAPHTSVRHALAQRHTVYPRAVCQIARVEGRTQPGYPETRYTIVRRPYVRSEEHTSELQSRFDLVCRLLL